MSYYWGHNRRYNAYSNYFKKKFGSRLQKVSIDAGFTCPNRDGSVSKGGCYFCDNKAFTPSYCVNSLSVSAQIEQGIIFHKNRYKSASGFLAYFQSYSNTYSEIAKLKEIYSQALNDERIVGIIIGTRPDCIDKEKLKYFQELAQNKYVVIEYGVESVYNKTLERVNRGHSFEQAKDSIIMTSEYGINVGAHFIFGLPGETLEMMMDSVKPISDLPLNNIKFHQLQLMKGTKIVDMYNNNPSDFCFFTIESYIEFIVGYIEKLNPKFVIERFSGEAPPRFNLTPGKWNLRNDMVLAKIEKRLEDLDTWQGKFFNNNF